MRLQGHKSATDLRGISAIPDKALTRATARHEIKDGKHVACPFVQARDLPLV